MKLIKWNALLNNQLIKWGTKRARLVRGGKTRTDEYKQLTALTNDGFDTTLAYVNTYLEKPIELTECNECNTINVDTIEFGKGTQEDPIGWEGIHVYPVYICKDCMLKAIKLFDTNIGAPQ